MVSSDSENASFPEEPLPAEEPVNEDESSGVRDEGAERNGIQGEDTEEEDTEEDTEELAEEVEIFEA